MLAAASSPYQTFGAYTRVPSAEPNPSDSRKSSKPKRTFLALIASVALLSLLGFAVHSGSAQKEELLSEAKSFAQKMKRHGSQTQPVCLRSSVGVEYRTEEQLFETSLHEQFSVHVTFTVEKDEAATILRVGAEGASYPRISWEGEGRKLELLFKAPGETKKAVTFAGLFEIGEEHRLRVEQHGEIAGQNQFLVRVFLDGRFVSDAGINRDILSALHGPLAVTAWPGVSAAGEALGSVFDVAVCAGLSCRYASLGEPTKLKKGQKLDWKVDTSPRMEMSMLVWLWKKGAFFQIGNEDREEFPLLYFRGRENNDGVCDPKHAGKGASMSIAFEKDKQSGQTKKEIGSKKSVPCRQWTEVQVLIDELRVQLFVGGELVEKFDIDEDHEVIEKDRKVWIGGPWNNDAEGEIKDIKVCTL